MAFASVQSDPALDACSDDEVQPDTFESHLLCETAAGSAADAKVASSSESASSDDADSDQDDSEQPIPANAEHEPAEQSASLAAGTLATETGSATVEEDILEDALSEQSEDCDLFAVAVDQTKGFTTYEDRALEPVAVSTLLGDSPLLAGATSKSDVRDAKHTAWLCS